MIGALVEESGQTRFRVWAPRPRKIVLELLSPRRRVVSLEPSGDGYFEALVEGVGPGARYYYRIDGERCRPDPASRSQPEGVHGPSEIVALCPEPTGSRRPMEELVLYELHVGTFSREGTFDAVAAQLGRLVDLGVTAVEVMPVAAFAGRRNWGYDGVAWYAPQATYGGPAGLRRLVAACHAQGLQVILDVVYNHLGPEGNYLAEFGPYFTDRAITPWGPALDYATGPVRAHALGSAQLWFDEYGIDGLRLDAVHAIVRPGEPSIVAELAALGHRLGRVVIAECEREEASVVEAAPHGLGCDSVWADDLHHALHAVLTGERWGYYRDFGPNELERALTSGFAYTGEWSTFRRRFFGTPAKHLPGARFVVCSQNHDQIGNRARGERLAMLRPGCEHVAAALVLCAPGVPLLFMGEEHGDPAPFLYFTDFQDPILARAVTEGRRREHLAHGGEAMSETADPQDPETFERSRIDLARGETGRGERLRAFYRALLLLRRDRPSLRQLDHARTYARYEQGALWLRRISDGEELLLFVALTARPVQIVGPAPRRGRWQVLLDAGEFGGAKGARLEDLATAVLPGFGVLLCGAE